MKTKKHWIAQWLWKLILINFLFLGSCDLVEDVLPDDDKDLPEVSLLNGEWLRVDGNNESANGMRVDVSNGSASILDPSATSLSIGDVKWKDIQAVEENLFEHQELGSDGNYYDATIELISDNEIEINVGVAGSGNFQRWIRATENNEYEKMQGLWIIVVNASDPDNGTIVIDVKGSAGKIILNTNSSASSGDIIWKDIALTGSNTFTVKILGADGNFYNATITIISENEIEIEFDSGETENYSRFDGPADLSLIQGEWTRVESNNPSSDYMQVNVENDQATVIDRAQSGFSVGDIKWKDITPTGDGNFTHQELGSDGQYYDGNITIVNDSTLEIVVGSTGAGNAQKWVRNAPAVTVELECNINSETTLINTPASVDYKVKAGCVVDITAPLTIEPGVVIEFEENAGFGVYDNGSIKAVGMLDDPIILRGTNPVRGFWRGIHIETNSLNNLFEYVTIQDAGSNYVYCCNEKASIMLKDGQVHIENSTIENGGAYGIYVNKNAENLGLLGVTITTHDDYPLGIPIEQAGGLNGNDFSGNVNDYIEIFESNVGEETYINPTNIPFLIDKVIDITEGLTIYGGTELVMRENAGLGVYDNGYFRILGEPDNYVIIRGYEAVQGYWRGIHMETSSINNDIEFLKISDAGSNYVYCCNNIATIFLKSGTATIANTIISNGAGYGVATGKNFEFGFFTGNSIYGHKDYPMYIHAENVTDLDASDSFKGNDKDFVAIYDSQIVKDIYWPWINVPYLIDQNKVIDIRAKVTIEDGTEIVFQENAGLGVYDAGILNAVGTDNLNIIFRGKSDVVGFWRGIHVETNSQDNILDHCQILNAGSNYVYCCNDKAAIFLKSGQLKVTNGFIYRSGGCGISVRSGATLIESANIFTANTDGNICN